MNYKFQVGELVKVNHTGDLGLVTGIPVPYVDGLGCDGKVTRYTVLIQGVACKLPADSLTKVSESNEL